MPEVSRGCPPDHGQPILPQAPTFVIYAAGVARRSTLVVLVPGVRPRPGRERSEPNGAGANPRPLVGGSEARRWCSAITSGPIRRRICRRMPISREA